MSLPEISFHAPVGNPDGPLVVLGHSLGTGPLIWEKVVPLLTPAFRVALVDLPGHGAAPVPSEPFTMDDLADAVAEATKSYVPSGALYAGVSIGGAIGLTLAERHPDVFSGVASIASAAFLGGPEHWGARAELVRERSTSALVEASAKVWFAQESFEREPDLLGGILRTLQNVSTEGYARCAEALGGYDMRERLRNIEIPVLAMGGQLDSVAPEDRQDDIVAAVRNGRKVIIPGVAHQPPAERPGPVATKLIEFFKEVAR